MYCREPSHLLGVLFLVISANVFAQERLCPDGKRSYFGACPDGGNDSRRLPIPEPRPVPIQPTRVRQLTAPCRQNFQ